MENAIIKFSRNPEVIKLYKTEVQRLSEVFNVLYDESLKTGSTRKEVLYARLFITFRQESFLSATNQKQREITIVEDDGQNSEYTEIALSLSEDNYLKYSIYQLKTFAEDLHWMVVHSERCTDETKVFLKKLIREINEEVKLTDTGAQFNNIKLTYK